MTSEVTLYKYESSDIEILIRIFFNDENQLILEGCDFGDAVKSIYGDSDYEYYYTIKPFQVNRLAKILKVKKPQSDALLLKIKERFEGKDAYSKFGEFLKENEIVFTKFTWV